MDWRRFWKKTWYFIWESDSILSWIVNIILAFIIIKFIVYPGLGFLLQTSYPIVAVVSGSMEHKTVHPCIDFNRQINDCSKYDENVYYICGDSFSSKQSSNLDSFWKNCGSWYEENTIITKENFKGFKFKNGFNKGDIMVLRGVKPKDVKRGDTIVYTTTSTSYPIIHRVVDVKEENSQYIFTTKGDHNSGQDAPVNQERLIGKAVLRIPLLGWIKIGFVNLIRFTGVVI